MIMVARAKISMVKLSRVEQGLSHELGVCLGYAQPRPEYSRFVATAWMGSRQAIFPKLLQVDNVCGGCSIRLASAARPQAASSRIAFMQHAMPLPFPPPQAGEG